MRMHDLRVLYYRLNDPVNLKARALPRGNSVELTWNAQSGDDTASQEGAYSQYNPNGGDAGDAGEAGSLADEAPGIELDDKGFPKNKYVNGYSFSGCEYWPYAVSTQS